MTMERGSPLFSEISCEEKKKGFYGHTCRGASPFSVFHRQVLLNLEKRSPWIGTFTWKNIPSYHCMYLAILSKLVFLPKSPLIVLPNFHTSLRTQTQGKNWQIFDTLFAPLCTKMHLILAHVLT